MNTKLTPPNLTKGESVYFLYGYDLMKGIVESVGVKNVKLNFNSYGGGNLHTTFIPFDKVVKPEEIICVVWECWKGRNGRGGYRIERELYPEYRRPSKNWPHQQLVGEIEYSKLAEYQSLDYFDGKKKY